MRKSAILGLALGVLGTACGADEPMGQELATLSVSVQSLNENTTEIDLPAGPTEIAVVAVAKDAMIDVNVTVRQGSVVVASWPLSLPNQNPKIPAGLTTSASANTNLVVNVTNAVTLALVFGPSAGQGTASGLDVVITVSQQAPAPTINFFVINPGPKFSPGQQFKLDVSATNNAGTPAQLTASAQILDSASRLISDKQLSLAANLLTGTLAAPAAGGDYQLVIRVADQRDAVTTDSKIISVR